MEESEKVTEPIITYRRQAKMTETIPVSVEMANIAQVLALEKPPVVQCISYASTEAVPFMDYPFDLETIPNHNEQCKKATVSVVQNGFHKAVETNKVNIAKNKDLNF